MSVLASIAEYQDGVRCVVMPCCGFTFDAIHTDGTKEPLSYDCPLCDDKVVVRNEALYEASKVICRGCREGSPLRADYVHEREAGAVLPCQAVSILKLVNLEGADAEAERLTGDIFTSV